MASFEHPWKILDFEMDVVTRQDIGLPSLGRSMKSEEIFDDQRVDCARD